MLAPSKVGPPLLPPRSILSELAWKEPLPLEDEGCRTLRGSSSADLRFFFFCDVLSSSVVVGGEGGSVGLLSRCSVESVVSRCHVRSKGKALPRFLHSPRRRTDDHL